MPPTGPKFRDALQSLSQHGVEFIVVGGVAAVLQGAPIATFDLDVVHRRTPDNVDRLLRALGTIHARYRDLAGRTLVPTAAALLGEGHHLLITDHGPLDLLGVIGSNLAYEALVGQTSRMDLDGTPLLVLDLAAVVRIKEQLGRDKDLASLAVLRRTLALRPGPGKR